MGLVDSEACKIIPGLFIGSYMAEENKEGLLSAGVTHVLQVRGFIAVLFV